MFRQLIVTTTYIFYVLEPMKLNKLKQILACFPPDIHKGAAGADDSELTCVRKKVKGLLLDDI